VATEPHYPDNDSVDDGHDFLLGHAGPYFPYDPDDHRAPIKEKRAPGFVTVDDYVRGGVVKQYKSRRSPKRANQRKR
jgi:hypothetical protein